MKRKIFYITLFLFLSALFTPCLRADDVTYLTTEEFKARVFDYTKHREWRYAGELPCIIDFYTTWCRPCKQLAPILAELSEEYCGEILVYKVDTERERELAAVFGISSIPTLLFCPVKGRPQMARGLLPKTVLIQAINEILLNNNQ